MASRRYAIETVGHPKAARLRRLAIGLFVATVPGLGLVFLYANERAEVPSPLCAGPVSLVWIACIPMFVGSALWTLSSLKGSEPPRRPWIMLIFNLLLWGVVMGATQRCLF